jgi:hypothetical protein
MKIEKCITSSLTLQVARHVRCSQYTLWRLGGERDVVQMSGRVSETDTKVESGEKRGCVRASHSTHGGGGTQATAIHRPWGRAIRLQPWLAVELGGDRKEDGGGKGALRFDGAYKDGGM